LAKDFGTDVLRLALWVAIVGLVLAVVPIWPYGYFVLLRLAVSAVAICGLVVLGIGDPKRTVGLSIVALLFNPILPVHLTRAIWFPIDLGIAFWFWKLVADGQEKLEEG
jgi:hypothetical protein